MKRMTMLVVLALVGVLPVYGAPDIQIQAAEVVGFGIFEAASTRSYRGYSGSLVPSDSVAGVQFVKYTEQIPAVLGTNFGFQYIINSRPRGRKVDVTLVIRVPGEGMQRPNGKIYKEFKYKQEVMLGNESLHGYGFDESWEIVPGIWEFEVWFQKALIVRRKFDVVATES